MEKMPFSEYVRLRREQLGYSQAFFAKRIHLDLSRVQRIENGEEGFPLYRIPRLTKVLKCSLEDLFTRNLENPHRKSRIFKRLRKLPKQLNTLREKAGVSLEKLGQYFNFKPKELQSFEAGEIEPTFEMTEAYSEIPGASLEQLFQLKFFGQGGLLRAAFSKPFIVGVTVVAAATAVAVPVVIVITNPAEEAPSTSSIIVSSASSTPSSASVSVSSEASSLRSVSSSLPVAPSLTLSVTTSPKTISYTLQVEGDSDLVKSIEVFLYQTSDLETPVESRTVLDGSFTDLPITNTYQLQAVYTYDIGEGAVTKKTAWIEARPIPADVIPAITVNQTGPGAFSYRIAHSSSTTILKRQIDAPTGLMSLSEDEGNQSGFASGAYNLEVEFSYAYGSEVLQETIAFAFALAD
ncbi:MAG: helix-turn-helix domain-containing protein [Bacilli bacterium]|nr:helix-turn-helix domain-containing protein [Bacilli bacterium]